MKILALSDLQWDKESKSLSLHDILKMSEKELLSNPLLSRVKYYFDIVSENSPEILFLCGDITGDGSCGHGYINSIISFLILVEKRKIHCRYISGNHDEPIYFDAVVNYFIHSTYIKKCSDSVELLFGLKIVGLSFEQTSKITSLKKILDIMRKDELDFVICHCPHTLRLNLFEFNTKYIITGHYDLKLINPNHKTFISLDNDYPCINFASINLDRESANIIFTIIKNGNIIRHCFLKEKDTFNYLMSDEARNPLLRQSNENFVYNVELQNAIEFLIKKKKDGVNVTEAEIRKLLQIRVNLSQRISLSFLKGYI